MRLAPSFIETVSLSASGFSLATQKLMMTAGISQLNRAGTKRLKNWPNDACPFCHTIRVVISPKGEKAPPALAPTTILIQARATNFLLFGATAITTAPMSRAVVRLSAMGEITKARKPVIQKILRRENPLETSQERRA